MDKDDGFVGMIVFTVVLCVIILIGLVSTEIINGNDALQKDFNRSVVECVEAGGSPIECRAALINKNP